MGIHSTMSTIPFRSVCNNFRLKFQFTSQLLACASFALCVCSVCVVYVLYIPEHKYKCDIMMLCVWSKASIRILWIFPYYCFGRVSDTLTSWLSMVRIQSKTIPIRDLCKKSTRVEQTIIERVSTDTRQLWQTRVRLWQGHKSMEHSFGMRVLDACGLYPFCHRAIPFNLLFEHSTPSVTSAGCQRSVFRCLNAGRTTRGQSNNVIVAH